MNKNKATKNNRRPAPPPATHEALKKHISMS